MKKVRTFIKDRMITGIIVLIPIAVVVIILKDVLNKLMAATEPLTSFMAHGGVLLQTLVAIILVVLALAILFLISGIILKTYFGNSFKNWLELKILFRLPYYKTIRGITHQFSSLEEKKNIVVEVDLYGNNNKQLGLLTGTLPDGRHLIYIPYAPVLSIGQVHIVPGTQVEKSDLSFKAARDLISRLGFGAGDLLKDQ